MIESRAKRRRMDFLHRTCRARDIHNRMLYGSAAPRYCERIWIRPRDVSSIGGLASREMSGLVVHE